MSEGDENKILNELNIEILPDDMLLEIFKYLDGKSLVNASKCNLRWKDLIRNSLSLMKKIEFAIILTNHLQENGFAVLSDISYGRYQNLFIGTKNNNDQIIEMPRTLMSNIRDLKDSFRNVTLSNMHPSVASNVLMNLEMMTKLVLSRVAKIFAITLPSPSTVELPNLKHLEAIFSIDFLKNLKVDNLEVLKVHEANFADGKLNSILKSCVSLTELQISSSSTSNNFLNIESFRFHLKKLSLVNIKISDEKLHQLLQSQKESLEELSIVCGGNSLDLKESYEFILNDMKLISLTVSLNVIQNIECDPNESIKRLVIFGNIPEVNNNENSQRELQPRQQDQQRRAEHIEILPIRRVRLVFQPFELLQDEPHIDEIPLNQKVSKFNQILSHCKSVEDLSIFKCNIMDEALAIALTNLHQLKILKIENVPKALNPTLNFDNLIRLEIDEVTKDDFTPYLVAYCSNLKVLKVNSVKGSYDINGFGDAKETGQVEVARKILMTAKNLEEAHFGFEAEKIREAVDMMQRMRYCGNKMKFMQLKHFKLMGKHKIEAIKYESASHFVKNEFKTFVGEMARSLAAIEEKSIKISNRK